MVCLLIYRERIYRHIPRITVYNHSIDSTSIEIPKPYLTLMRVQKLTRKQAKELLKTRPISHILTGTDERLSKKQKDFAYNLAIGETKAQAYRNAYREGKPSVRKKADGNKGSELAKHEGIQREVEAIKAGLAFQEAYSLGQIKALVVSQLTKEALNEDNQGSTRVNALKTLGTVAGVDAFVHRTETKVIKESAQLKEELLAKLKEALADEARTVDADAEALLAEIENRSADDSGAAETPPGATPLNSEQP